MKNYIIFGILKIGDYMKIEDAIKDFLSYCIFEKGLSDKTITSYSNDLTIYNEFLKKKRIFKVQDIKNNDIQEFLKIRNDEQVSTIAHNLTVIKNFHAYLFRENIVKNNVAEFIERPKLRKSIPKTMISITV